MATIEGDVTEQITSEVDLFGSIIQQTIIENEFNREYTLLATIQQGMAIEFAIKGANDVLGPEQLATACARKNHKSGRNEHWREHNGFDKPDAALNVSQNWLRVKRSKRGRHESALPVPLTPGDFSQLLQQD